MSDELYHSTEQVTSLPAIIPPAALVLRRIDSAIGLMRDVVQESSAEYWYEKGRLHNKSYEWAAAEYSLRRFLAMKLDLSNRLDGMDVVLQLALALTQQNKCDAAMEILSSNYETLAKTIMAWVLFGMRDLRNLLQESLIRHESITHFDSNYLYLLSLVLTRFGKHSLARVYLEKIYSATETSSSKSAFWLKTSGQLWQRQKELGKALDDYNELISFDSNDVHCLECRGLVKARLNDYEGALMDFEKIFNLDPQIVESLEDTVSRGYLGADVNKVYLFVIASLKMK